MTRPGGSRWGTGPVVGRTVLAYAAFTLVELAIWLAVILWAFDRGGAGLAAVVAVAQLVPAAVVAPLLASIGDRVDRSRALLVAHLGMAGTTGLTGAVLWVQAPVWVVVLASTTATVAASVVRPLHYAALPSLADRPEQLVTGNAGSSGVQGLSAFTGPALAGLGVATLGAGPTLVIGSGLAAGAAALCLRLPVAPPVAALPGARTSAWREATEGVRVLRHDAAALALLLVLAVEFVLSGALDILGTAYADQVLGLGETGAGLLLGAGGLGTALGALVAARLSRRPRLAGVAVLACIVQGAGVALVAAATALPVAALVVAGSGVGAAVTLVAGLTLLQRSTDERVLARVLAVQESTTLVGLAVGAGLAPALALLSPRWAFVPLGVGAAVLAVAVLRLVRRLDARSQVAAEAVELLRLVPFLAPLPPFELERLASRATWLDLPADGVLLRQGDPAAAFYVVAAGHLAVEVDGVRRDHLLSRGDGLGEIALLRTGRRTATVTARDDVRLLAVRAQDFLAAVTGSADGQRVAGEVAAAHLARDLATR